MMAAVTSPSLILVPMSLLASFFQTAKIVPMAKLVSRIELPSRGSNVTTYSPLPEFDSSLTSKVDPFGALLAEHGAAVRVLSQVLLDEVVGVNVQVKLLIAECIGGTGFVDGSVFHHDADFLAALKDSCKEAVDSGIGRVDLTFDCCRFHDLDYCLGHTQRLKGQYVTTVNAIKFSNILSHPMKSSAMLVE